MAEFTVPLHAEDLADDGVQVVGGLEDLHRRDMGALLDTVEDMLTTDPTAIHSRDATVAVEGAEVTVFDFLYSAVWSFGALSPLAKSRVVAIAAGALKGAAALWTDATADGDVAGVDVRTLRNAYRRHAFLLHMIADVTEKEAAAKAGSAFAGTALARKGKKKNKKAAKKARRGGSESDSDWEPESGASRRSSGGGGSGAGGDGSGSEAFDWGRQLVIVLEALATAAATDMRRLWSMTTPEDDYLACFYRTVYVAMESPVHCKAASIRGAMWAVIVPLVASCEHGIAGAAALIHLLIKYEHVAAPMAELMGRLAASPAAACRRVVAEVISAIANLDGGEMSRDASGTKNAGAFLECLANERPALVKTFLPSLLPLLDADSYPIRNSVVRALGFVVAAEGRPSAGGEAGQGPTEGDRAAPSGAHGVDDDPAALANAALMSDIFDILEERLRDTTSYVRSKTLQTWQFLVGEKAVPLSRFVGLACLARGRLQDKAALVRKNALVLITEMVGSNPYAPLLHSAPFEAQLAEANAALVALGVVAAGHEANSSDQVAEGSTVDGNSDNDNDNDDDDDDDEAADKERDPRVVQVRRKAAYCTDALAFIAEVEGAMPLVAQLLGSKTQSDITAAIDFVVAAARFKVSVAQVGVRKMLMLVWSKEKSIKESVLEAFSALYLTAPEDMARSGKARAAFVASNLVELTLGASLAEMTSLSEFLPEVLATRAIDGKVVSILWDVFAPEGETNISTEHSVGALVILAMLGEREPVVIRSRLDLLLERAFAGFGDDGADEVNFDFAKQACIAIKHLAKDGSRLEAGHKVFSHLAALVTAAQAGPAWHPAAEEALNAVFLLHPQPDEFCAGLVRSLHRRAFSEGGEHASERLARLLFAVGHVAVKQLVFIEERHRAHKAGRMAAAEAREAGGNGADDGDDDDDALAAELGLGNVAALEDAETELLAKICETQIVGPGTMLGAYAPIITRVCRETSVFTSELLRMSAVLALAKFMTVSTGFCEDHLQLLFSILHNAAAAPVRANIVICLGDLAFRHPNLLEPWTKHMYARLRDPALRVRKNALMVLTHLILNDMIKVKGQIAEIAMCLVDEDQRVTDLARLFFHEYSHKARALYNILPDTISRLSSVISGIHDASTSEAAEGSAARAVDHNYTAGSITTAEFRTIMEFLFSHLDKSREADALVVKLCHRFRATKDMVQWRNIAYCLSLLSYSQKGIKNLAAEFRSYHDKLYDDDVYTSFQAIINKARKFAKSDMRGALDEFAAKIATVDVTAAVPTGAEGEDPSALGAGGTLDGGDLPPPPPSARKTRPRRRAKAPAAGKKRRGGGRKAAAISSEESSSVELFDSESESEAGDSSGTSAENKAVDDDAVGKQTKKKKKAAAGTRRSSRRRKPLEEV